MENNPHTRTITIVDPEDNNKEYYVQLNDEDYRRATRDKEFANTLLFHARCSDVRNNNMPKTIIQPQSPETYIDEEGGGDELEDSLLNNGDDVFLSENPNEIANLNRNIKIVHTWAYDEVTALINSMGNHMDDFNHPKKRKHVYEHVANDLLSAGYNNITAIMIQNKWKSLVKSYREGKDNKTRTGTASSRFLFFNLMDELLGTQPTNSCSHSLNSEDAVHEVQEEPGEHVDIDDSRPETASSNEGIAENDDKAYKRLSAKRLRLNYVNTKQEEYGKREERHKERMELEKEKLEVEKKKVELLQDYFNYLKNKN